MQHKKYLLLIFGAAVISGFSIFLNSYAVKLANPAEYTLIKNFVPVLVASGLLMFPFARRYFTETSIKEWAHLLVIGLIGGAVPFILFFQGLSLTSGSLGSFIHKTMFIWIAILAISLLKEKVKPLFFAGAFAVLIGNWLLLKVSIGTLGAGHIMILAATLFWAVENILSKRLINSGTPVLMVIWSRMAFGSIFIAMYLFARGSTFVHTEFPISLLPWTLATGLLLTGYVFTWYYGLKKIPLATAAIILLLGSPITSLLDFFFSGKVLIGGQMFGIVLLVIGVVITVYLYKKMLMTAKNIIVHHGSTA